MIIKNQEVEITRNNTETWTRTTYVCELETPCCAIDYIYSADGELKQVNINKAYTTYFDGSNWKQRKEFTPCEACKKEMKKAIDLAGNIRAKI